MEIWNPLTKVIKHWEGSRKSEQPKVKSYETLVKHYLDPLIPAKLQFFASIASIFEPYLTLFQTDSSMIPFMYEQLEDIYDKLLSKVFRTDVLQKTSITKKLKQEFITKKENQLENGLVDIGAATKLKLNSVKVSAEKKRKFKGECKEIIVNTLLKLAEKSPIIYSIVRNAKSLDPLNMVRHHNKSSQEFKKLADSLHALKKITAKTADEAKSQFDGFLKTAQFDERDKFLNFNFRKDRLDVFFGNVLSKSNESLWKVIKIICILSHGQSFTERGFSINKELNDCNMQAKSLVSQRIVYDAIQDFSCDVKDITITTDMRKSCLLSNQRYKAELEKTRKDKALALIDEKKKEKDDEIPNLKLQISNVEKCINSLQDEVFNLTIQADENQDLVDTSKAASLCHQAKAKKATLKTLQSALKKVEKEYKELF